ncbi:ribonuclease H-like domain-containing protein [Daldinia caldariorum]|uniref:ribonuclease H-like domain-containing protein n=1 Tax=Daldinia caldariorum TaxID=326644 RepID=UPI0020075108|nr:ribonuclease H-like domain-containing protein [Daldinia caldariorum]KAI1469161.1 ribonuclease H-like domain-containing protein [Daldinia caldariorum]
MEPPQDFKSMQEKIQTALVATTRLTNQIAAEDISFQKTSNPDVEEQLDDTSSRLLSLASSLLASATKGTDLKAPALEDSDDVDVHWSRIVDVVDTLLEKADTCLDEYTGVIKRKAAPTEQPGPPSKKSKPTTLETSLRRANIIKPQNAFELKPNNLDPSPWKPILTAKPHALTPLKKSLDTFIDDNQATQYKHPYETEILKLQYPKAVFQTKEPIKYQPVETTTATFVDTFEGVLDMLKELKNATEIAIDTEHHDFRTYSGLLSLMQISTREKDWVVDTLQPWRHKLEVLNEVFADPKIVKVLHGAYMDIIWLQRDCGLYIVGLFDTFEAAVALQYPSRSLAYLLKKFVDFDADKKYQLADWRIRPIPDEMFYYARSDTHYLLYIYDMMRNELLQQPPGESGQNLMNQVLDKSKETSLRRHETSTYDSDNGQGPFGWFNLLIRQSAGKFSREQFAVFRAVHKWRDEVARREDESSLFVMSNAALFDIARRMPPDPKALHSLLDSTSHIAKREAFDLFKIISKAKAEGLNGPSVAEVIRSNAPPTMGIGEIAKAVLPQLRSNDTEISGMEELVSQTSRLWGKVPISSRWDGSAVGKPKGAVQFELPWAQFIKSGKVLEVVDTPAQEPETQMEESIIQLEEEAVDIEFTLKTGLKRKAPEIESDSDEGEVNDTPSKSESTSAGPMDTDEIAVPDSDDSEEERRKRKAKKAEKRARKEALKEERRQAKKLAKKARKEASADAANKGEGENEDEDEDEDEPFDYSKAKSVLTAARASNRAPQGAKFNPYGMTMEGPKPARKMHGEKAGKSATFRK